MSACKKENYAKISGLQIITVTRIFVAICGDKNYVLLLKYGNTSMKLFQTGKIKSKLTIIASLKNEIKQLDSEGGQKLFL